MNFIKFLVPLILLSTTLFGQKEIKITDPEIAFSMVIPGQWEQSDDGYYLLISPPTSTGEENLSITYFDLVFDSVEENFNADMKHQLPQKLAGFKLLETGTDQFGETKAQWAIYDFKSGGNKYRSIAYYFKQQGQLFKVQGQARKKKFRQLKEDYVSIIHSIRSEKL